MSKQASFLQNSIRKKKVDQVRTNRIIIALSSTEVGEYFLTKALLFISYNDYYDAFVRRSDNGLCGYFLCDKENKFNSTVAVKLDVHNKKIYNIENRKRFCSDWCYGASKFLREQLSTTPHWMVENLPTNFKFYSAEAEGCKGELMFNKETLVDTSNYAENCKPIEELPDLSSPDFNEEKIDKIQTTIKQLDDILLKRKSLEDVVRKIKDRQKNKPEKKLIYLDEMIKEDNIPSEIQNDENKIMIDKVIEFVSSWITPESKAFLEKTKENNFKLVNEEVDCYSFIPPLDHEHQFILRRAIIIKRIKSCGSKIIGSLNISFTEFFSALHAFLKTCKLTSQNILFNSGEYKLLTIVLINLLKDHLNTWQMTKENEVDLSNLLKENGIDNSFYYQNEIDALKDLFCNMKLNDHNDDDEKDGDESEEESDYNDIIGDGGDNSNIDCENNKDLVEVSSRGDAENIEI